MNIRLIASLIVFASLPALAQAADKSAVIAERAALAQTLGRGATLTSNKQQYQVLTDVRATECLPQEQPQQALTRAGGGKLIETKGSYVVFTAAPQSAVSVMQVKGATSYPTALNQRTGVIGILTGTLNVKLKNMAATAAVAADHSLEVVRQFAKLQTVFYRVKPGQDVVAAAVSLAADPRIASAEAEVIEYLNAPN